jgi:NADH-quinone oxidoreductase subunit J
MDWLMSNLPLVLFLVVGGVAVASAMLVVMMRNPVHSALFLLVAFLCVAVLFVMQGAEFVGAVQVLVYAGGIMVLFLFVVMLINVRTLPREKMLSPVAIGAVPVGVLIFIILGAIAGRGGFAAPIQEPQNLRSTKVETVEQITTADGSTVERKVVRMEEVGNSEAVGMALYQEYLVPFEVASLFLLVAMIGAIVIGKRELSADEEEAVSEHVKKRVADERRVKEVTGA